MKTFRFFGMALVAVMLGLAMSSCDSDDEDYQFTYENPYKDYAQLIVGKWFCFTPESSIFMNYQADGSFYQVGYGAKNGWRERIGTYEINENIVNGIITNMDNTPDVIEIVELSEDKFVLKTKGSSVHTSYRVQEQFDITGKYAYLNSVVRVAAKEGKTEMQLPEGITIGGMNSISVEAMNGGRIIEQMKEFFADATFSADGKLTHTMDGESKVKNYTLEGNNLTFDLYEGGAYKVNATTFPDEDGDRLFIIIPKQAAWLGGMVELVEKENEGLTLDAAQIAALEKEFMETFETFTVILSLSKK
ncbi:MAG: lipocalin family protein [Paraprevotella sp.]|nr:lipocalin family protein [Paraprevotella sp.]